MKSESSSSVDAYISAFPKETQILLQRVRETIREAAGDAEETINYGIPTFKLHGKNLVHFAGYKHHIGFYPGSSGIAAFKEKLSKYKSAKGSVQFPLDAPIPLKLIATIVKYRISEEHTIDHLNKKK